MKCPVCNETEVSPTKEGLIPDCSWCQNASNEAALISPTVGDYSLYYDAYEMHPDEVVWENDWEDDE